MGRTVFDAFWAFSWISPQTCNGHNGGYDSDHVSAHAQVTLLVKRIALVC